MLIGTGPCPGSSRASRATRNFFAVAQAKSFTVSATKCQTSRSPGGASPGPGPTSSAPTIVITSSDSSTCVSRSRAVGVSTSCGFCSTPVPLTIQPPGTSMLHVEAAEVVVELRRAEIELRVPAAQVVVDGDARIPLRRLEQRVAQRCVMRWPRPRAAGQLVFHSISSVAADFGAIGVGSVIARDGLIESRHAERPRPRRCRVRRDRRPPPLRRRGARQVDRLAVHRDAA